LYERGLIVYAGALFGKALITYTSSSQFGNLHIKKALYLILTTAAFPKLIDGVLCARFWKNLLMINLLKNGKDEKDGMTGGWDRA
jgi:hypothetical protein